MDDNAGFYEVYVDGDGYRNRRGQHTVVLREGRWRKIIRNRRMSEADMWSSCGRRERVRGSQDCEEMIRECIMIKMLVPRNLDRDLKL